jgi:hypothetical protein
MKFPLNSILRLGALVATTALLSGPVRADDDDATTTSRIKFSDPAKPGTLKASLPWADLHVTGTTGNEIVVTSTLKEKGAKQERPDGLRRLDEEVSFELSEKNNTATIQIVGDNPWAAQGAEFKIELPHNTSLVLRTEAGGDMLVENIDGDIDITSMNGEVTLRDIGSSAVVNTMNGEINAVFKTAPVKAVSFSSMNGEIFVKLPVDTKANLRMRSHNGAILTDFPDSILKAKSENRSHGEDMAENPEAESPDAPPAEVAAERAMHDAEKAVRDAAKVAARDAARAARDAQRAVLVSDSAVISSDQTPVAPRAPHMPRMPRIPMVPAFGGKSVVGTLNGGGVDVQLATMNGTITLRQVK